MHLLAATLSKLPDVHIEAMIAHLRPRRLPSESADIRLIDAFELNDRFILKVAKMLVALFRSRGQVMIQRTMTPFTFLLAVFCRLSGKRFVYMIAHDREVQALHSVRAVYRRLAFRFSTVTIYQNSDQEAALRNLRSVKIAYLPSSSPHSIMTHPRGFDQRSTVLWVGRITAIKRPETFLEIARQLPDIHFTMIGSPATNQEDFHREIAVEASQIPNLSFLPGLSLDATRAYFESAWALVSTSAGEGMPATFVQAWSSGTPVISLSVDPDSRLKHESLGVFCNNSTDALVHAVRELTEAPEVFVAFSKRCLEHAQRNHDPVINANKLLQLVSA